MLMHKGKEHFSQTQGSSIQHQYFANFCSNFRPLIAYYEELQNALKVVKSDEVLIVEGNLNTKVRKGKDDYIIGQHGLGSRNEKRDRLVQFCVQRDICIMNTFFQHPELQKYTWKSPSDVHRYQIDYLMIQHSFKNSVVQCKTYPGADIGSYHNQIISKIKVKPKKMQKASKKPPKVEIAKAKKKNMCVSGNIEKIFRQGQQENLFFFFFFFFFNKGFLGNSDLTRLVILDNYEKKKYQKKLYMRQYKKLTKHLFKFNMLF